MLSNLPACDLNNFKKRFAWRGKRNDITWIQFTSKLLHSTGKNDATQEMTLKHFPYYIKIETKKLERTSIKAFSSVENGMNQRECISNTSSFCKWWLLSFYQVHRISVSFLDGIPLVFARLFVAAWIVHALSTWAKRKKKKLHKHQIKWKRYNLICTSWYHLNWHRAVKLPIERLA